MNLAIHVSMNETSLAPFRAAWQQAAHAAGQRDAGELARAARLHQREAAQRNLPSFIAPHIATVGEVIRLLEDRSWPLPEATRRDLQGALTYFVDEADLIPDAHSKFGLLDDAIVLELALAEHEHEWLAWQEFDRFRRDYPECGRLDRVSWMRLRREELDAALRHRRRLQGSERQRYAAPADARRFRVH